MSGRVGLDVCEGMCAGGGVVRWVGGCGDECGYVCGGGQEDGELVVEMGGFGCVSVGMLSCCWCRSSGRLCLVQKRSFCYAVCTHRCFSALANFGPCLLRSLSIFAWCSLSTKTWRLRHVLSCCSCKLSESPNSKAVMHGSPATNLAWTREHSCWRVKRLANSQVLVQGCGHDGETPTTCMLNTSNKGTMSNFEASKKNQGQSKHCMFEGTIEV